MHSSLHCSLHVAHAQPLCISRAWRASNNNLLVAKTSYNAVRSRTRCLVVATKDAGRLLRDAMQQPKQGSNLSLLAAGNYLRTLGIENQADVTRILDILTNKNSLFGTKGGKTPINPYARKITVEEMQETVDFFITKKGLKKEAVVGIILEFPQVLCYSVTERLVPFYEYLESPEVVGMSVDQVNQLITRRPNTLGLERDSVERIVGYLLYTNSSSMSDVVEMLEKSL